MEGVGVLLLLLGFGVSFGSCFLFFSLLLALEGFLFGMVIWVLLGFLLFMRILSLACLCWLFGVLWGIA
jgi:hypothetical protein